MPRHTSCSLGMKLQWLKEKNLWQIDDVVHRRAVDSTTTLDADIVHYSHFHAPLFSWCLAVGEGQPSIWLDLLPFIVIMKSRLSRWRWLFIIKSSFLAATLSAASCWAAFSSAWQERGCIFDQVMSFCLPRRSLTSGTPHSRQRAVLFAPSKETSTTDSAARPQDLRWILTLSEVAMWISLHQNVVLLLAESQSPDKCKSNVVGVCGC